MFLEEIQQLPDYNARTIGADWISLQRFSSVAILASPRKPTPDRGLPYILSTTRRRAAVPRSCLFLSERITVEERVIQTKFNSLARERLICGWKLAA